MNNKKKNLFYINIKTQQWTRQTRRKNSFDLINFPFANFKMIRTNEPFNPIIKHNQSNNAWKHGRSKCRHTPQKKTSAPVEKRGSLTQRRNVRARNQESPLISPRNSVRWRGNSESAKIHKLCYGCLLEIVASFDRERSWTKE